MCTDRPLLVVDLEVLWPRRWWAPGVEQLEQAVGGGRRTPTLLRRLAEAGTPPPGAMRVAPCGDHDQPGASGRSAFVG